LEGKGKKKPVITGCVMRGKETEGQDKLRGTERGERHEEPSFLRDLTQEGLGIVGEQTHPLSGKGTQIAESMSN
jgi:hypothetical protein